MSRRQTNSGQHSFAPMNKTVAVIIHECSSTLPTICWQPLLWGFISQTETLPTSVSPSPCFLTTLYCLSSSLMDKYMIALFNKNAVCNQINVIQQISSTAFRRSDKLNSSLMVKQKSSLSPSVYLSENGNNGRAIIQNSTSWMHFGLETKWMLYSCCQFHFLTSSYNKCFLTAEPSFSYPVRVALSY